VLRLRGGYRCGRCLCCQRSSLRCGCKKQRAGTEKCLDRYCIRVRRVAMRFRLIIWRLGNVRNTSLPMVFAFFQGSLCLPVWLALSHHFPVSRDQSHFCSSRGLAPLSFHPTGYPSSFWGQNMGWSKRNTVWFRACVTGKWLQSPWSRTDWSASDQRCLSK